MLALMWLIIANYPTVYGRCDKAKIYLLDLKQMLSGPVRRVNFVIVQVEWTRARRPQIEIFGYSPNIHFKMILKVSQRQDFRIVL